MRRFYGSDNRVLTMLWVRKEILLIINETHSGIIMINREFMTESTASLMKLNLLFQLKTRATFWLFQNIRNKNKFVF